MRAPRILIVAGLLLAPIAVAQDYLPMQRGNRWTVADPAHRKDQQTVAIPYAARPSYYWMPGFQGKAGFWTSRIVTTGYTSPTIWNYNAGRSSWYPLFRFNAPAATPWTTFLPDDFCGTTLHLQAENVTLQTPAGLFTGCRQYDFGIVGTMGVRCAKPAWASVVLAPGVGIVQIAGTDGITRQAWDVVANGKTYPTAPVATRTFSGVTLRLSLDAYRFDKSPSAEAKVSLRITNRTTGGLNATGMDVDVIDAAGNTVLTTGLAYNRTRAMLPGETRTLEGALPLRDAQGALLEGPYTMVVHLLGSADHVKVPFYVAPTELLPGN